jgi:diguanylate cyclase (GGDEF)-like protein/PAS domain S-box-containing protein
MKSVATINSDLLLALLNCQQEGAFIVQNQRFYFVNQAFCELLGYSEQVLLGSRIFDYVLEEDRHQLASCCQARMQGDAVVSEYYFRMRTSSGAVHELSMHARPYGECTDGPEAGLLLCSLTDVTEVNHTRRTLAHSQADIRSILENMPDIFYRTDMKGSIVLMSASCQATIGYRPEEMIGRPLSNFYSSPKHHRTVIRALAKGNGQARQIEVSMRHKDGHQVWISTNAYLRLGSKGQAIGVEGIARDINEHKALEIHLKHLARHDSLTGLLNRRSFLEETAAQIEISRRYQRPLVMMMLDLDWFKQVNDTYGHAVGDLALIHFASLCRGVFRKADRIARVGGEEFAVLMPETELKAAQDMLDRLRQQLQSVPLEAAEKRIFLSFSAGFTSLTRRDNSTEELLHRADQLLYQAKRTGRSRHISG